LKLSSSTPREKIGVIAEFLPLQAIMPPQGIATQIGLFIYLF